jgi:anti-sigma regulatory factor (Ser/Thr protein kinase)
MVYGRDAKARQRTILEFDVHRNSSAPAVARAATTGLCETVALTEDRFQTLLLLVSEIVTNAVCTPTRPRRPR